MSPRSHNRMTIVTIALTCLVSAAGTSVAQTPPAGAQACPSEGKVEVSGSGEATAQPDRALVSIGVTGEADTAQAALEANNRAMEQAIAAVKQAGVPAAQIRTETVQLHPRYGQPQRSTQGVGAAIAVTGYEAVNTVRVRVDELAKLGRLLDAVVTAGANTIEGIQLEVSDPAALLDQARAAAFADALHKARQLAGLAGQRLGEVLSISEFGPSPRPLMTRAVMAKAAAVPIEPGTQTITADVQVSWRLLPAQSP